MLWQRGKAAAERIRSLRRAAKASFGTPHSEVFMTSKFLTNRKHNMSLFVFCQLLIFPEIDGIQHIHRKHVLCRNFLVDLLEIG